MKFRVCPETEVNLFFSSMSAVSSWLARCCLSPFFFRMTEFDSPGVKRGWVTAFDGCGEFDGARLLFLLGRERLLQLVDFLLLLLDADVGLELLRVKREGSVDAGGVFDHNFCLFGLVYEAVVELHALELHPLNAEALAHLGVELVFGL